MQISNPINIFNPGCKDKFELTKEDYFYEYGYSTEIFLASKIHLICLILNPNIMYS